MTTIYSLGSIVSCLLTYVGMFVGCYFVVHYLSKNNYSEKSIAWIMASFLVAAVGFIVTLFVTPINFIRWIVLGCLALIIPLTFIITFFIDKKHGYKAETKFGFAKHFGFLLATIALGFGPLLIDYCQNKKEEYKILHGEVKTVAYIAEIKEEARYIEAIEGTEFATMGRCMQIGEYAVMTDSTKVFVRHRMLDNDFSWAKYHYPAGTKVHVYNGKIVKVFKP